MNDRLIAATPALLAALKRLSLIADEIDDCSDDGESWKSQSLQDAIATADAAIAKAEDKTP